GRASLVGPAAAAPRDELPQLIVADVGPEVLVARDDLLADPLELRGRQPRVDPHVLQRSVQPVDVLAHPEALAVEGPGDVEDAVADEEAAIEGIDLHLAERQILSVEVRDVVGHVSSSRAWGLDVGRCRFYPPLPTAKSACAAGRLDARAMCRVGPWL